MIIADLIDYAWLVPEGLSSSTLCRTTWSRRKPEETAARTNRIRCAGATQPE
jgi:hypothetical protein